MNNLLKHVLVCLCLFALTGQAIAVSLLDAKNALSAGDTAKAFKLYGLLAEQGNATAQFALGLMYFFGSGFPHDYKEAAKWFRLSAEQGNVDAQSKLGLMYFQGQGVAQDHEEAKKWFRLPAKKGDLNAAYYIKKINDEEEKIRAEEEKIHAEKSTKTFASLAEEGNALPQLNLGIMDDVAPDVSLDYKEAAKLWRLSAEQGNADAQAKLGLMYYQGRDVPQNYKEAAKWFWLSAKQGKAAAQYYLGIMYDAGQGVPQNNNFAYMWINLAADNATGSNIQGIVFDKRNSIADKLTAAQIYEAHQFVDKCKADKFEGC